MRSNYKNRINNPIKPFGLCSEVVENEYCRINAVPGLGEQIEKNENYKKYSETGNIEYLAELFSPENLISMIFNAAQ